MTRTVFALLVILCARPINALPPLSSETGRSSASFAQPPASTLGAQDRQQSLRDIVNKPVVYRVPGMDQVKVQTNLKYTTNPNPVLLMDVYVPSLLSKSERRPAVVFIHGGTPQQYAPKDWGVYVSWGRLVAASGMVGVTFTHRLGYPKPHLAEAAQDVTDAINYVRANADSLQIDRDRICLAAYSAGGPLLSLAMRGRLTFVKCLVSFYAFLDIQQSELHRNNETPEMLRSFSLITYLADAPKFPPIFVARAGLDQIPALNDSIDRFVKEAIARNATIDFANHPTGVHGFDNQNDDDRSREIIRRAVDFMKTHLGVTKTE
ncbi:MAG TPA: alpha/beta hydrolase [Blastocatellia bacterium]|nr:alpha/beta hydrolase [Blastocatellia bacterium]